ncbi:MAG TPA: methyltransferase domain-containing protein [Acidocella sp.]|nr:methyltransferase domain-containing protein [Acidocella sp.]HQU05003.1 methyltransferase domain-containing protein [Acidocella sp.]
MSTPIYDTAFYERAEKSAAAARAIISILQSSLTVGSVLDVGCARGTWLAAWQQAGCADIYGIDGAFITPEQLLISPDCFMSTDLAAPFNLGRRFDLVQCLEVAEHLPRRRSASLVADLTAHADAVLFSAAPPGQGGAGHINEAPYAFWRDLFAAHGYAAFDCVRPALQDQPQLPYWYRYNIFLYMKAPHPSLLPYPADKDLRDMSPLSFQIRKRILKHLPASAINLLARLVARVG